MRLKVLSSCLLVTLVCAAAAPSAKAQWTDLGLGLAGTGGTPPVLSTLGGLFPTAGTKLSITGGLPGGTGYLIVGLSNISASFKGGTLVPFPTIILPQSLDGSGNWQLIFSWPTDIPAGFLMYWQSWLPDAGGPHGFAATNAWESAAF